MGRASVVLLLLAAAAFATMMSLVAAGQRGGSSFTSNWWLSGPAIVAAIGAVGAFAVGLAAVVFRNDRSASVLVSATVGGFMTLVLIGEVAFPH